MSILWYELRYTLRLVKQSPAFVAICVAIVALGLSMAIVMYSAVSRSAYTSLPVQDGDRYTALISKNLETGVEAGTKTIDTFGYLYLKQNLKQFEEIGAYRRRMTILSSGDVARKFRSASIDVDLLESTGVKPFLGRVFHRADQELGAEPVAIVSHSVWKNYYAADPDIVGSVSRIDGRLATIVGVMPRGFKYPFNQDVWEPLLLDPGAQPSKHSDLDVIGIRRESVAVDDASREARGVYKTLAGIYPEIYAGTEISFVPYVQAYLVNSMMFIYLLIGVTVSTLCLVCINFGSLLIVRANERIQELAVRNALGASKFSLVRQVLFESLVICVLGGIVGKALGDLALQISRSQSLLSSDTITPLPYWFDFEQTAELYIVGILIILIMWLVTGGVTAWKVLRNDVSDILEGGNKGSATQGSGIATKAVVSIEVVFSYFLLIVSGLFIVAIQNARDADIGTVVDGYLTFSIDLPREAYATSQRRLNYYIDLRAAALSVPGVTDVALSTALPSQYTSPVRYDVGDRDLQVNYQFPEQGLAWVSANFFQVMGVEFVDGRSFSMDEGKDQAGVAVIDELFARQMWPDESAVGKRIQTNPSEGGEWLRIVGVTPHIIQGPTFGVAVNRPTVYRHSAQAMPSSFSISVKVEGDPRHYVQPIQLAAREVNRDIPLSHARTLKQLVDDSIGSIGSLSQVFISVAAVTLFLGAVGIYGIISRGVVQRTSEMGIRRALGLTNSGVIGVFLKEGLVYIAIGVVIGGGFALVVANELANLFADVMAHIPFIAISVFLVLALAIGVACYMPSRKIVRMEPSDALRYDG